MPKILIVEDAEVDRAYARALLEDDPEHEIDAVADGLEALAAIEAEPPDLVVTDLMMPGMDGLELLRTINERFPLVPVIIITSRGSEETAVHALQEGAASYVPKHILASVLPNTVETVLAAAVRRRKHAHLMRVMVKNDSSFVLENDRVLFRPLIQFLRDTMSEFGRLDGLELMRTCVAVEEALNNAAEHGNLELDSALRDEDFEGYLRLMRERCKDDRYRGRRIHFTATFTQSGAEFDITDEGAGFDPGAHRDAGASQRLEATSGRGLTLMRMFMDEVEFNETGNRVRLTKRWPQPTGGEP